MINYFLLSIKLNFGKSMVSIVIKLKILYYYFFFEFYYFFNKIIYFFDFLLRNLNLIKGKNFN